MTGNSKTCRTENKLHSFAVLAYKESPYLTECIESLMNQQDQSTIYISTSTPAKFISRIAEKYSLEVYVNQKSRGIASDWTFAYKQAKTKYVTLAHQDDIYSHEYTRYCLNHAEKHKKNLITFTDYSELFNGQIRDANLLLNVKRTLSRPFYLFKSDLTCTLHKKALISLGSPIPCPSVMYNVMNIGDFAFSDNFTVNVDWDAWLRLAEMKGDFIYVNKELMSHRIHPDSETSKAILEQRRKTEDLRMFERIWGPYLARVIIRLYSLSYKSNY